MAWTTPTTWVAGLALTATQLNQQLRDNLKAIGDPWTAYTPQWTSTATAPTLGNGVITGGYMQAGKLVHFWAKVTMGTTTTYGTGAYRLSLPVSIASTYPARFTTAMFDASAAFHFQGMTYSVSGTTAPIGVDNGATDGHIGAVGPAVPFTFATGDTIEIIGTYEAA